MWSLRFEGGIEEVKEGSGLFRRRLVVRRAEDSCLREVIGMSPAKDGRRKDKLFGVRREREMDMSFMDLNPRSRTEEIIINIFALISVGRY